MKSLACNVVHRWGSRYNLLVVASCLWDANKHSQEFSRGYSEIWVDRLYRGFARNLTVPFRFVLFSDRPREFSEPIDQRPLTSTKIDYGCFTEPYKLNEPMILVGLDTVIVRNIDHFAHYCMTGDKIALPRNPYNAEQSINGVALVPAGHRKVFDDWRGENDMEWMRKFPWQPIDDLWPGQVVSLKAHRIRDIGLGEARVVYFHGRPKQPELLHLNWIRDNWQ
jgi:hypothetical protein